MHSLKKLSMSLSFQINWHFGPCKYGMKMRLRRVIRIGLDNFHATSKL